MAGGKWTGLLQDPILRRWHSNLARGSQGTADERTRVLYRYLNRHNMTAAQLVEMATKNRRAVEDQLMDFIGELEAAGKSPGYIENYMKAVKSWLDFNEIRLLRKFKIRDRGATPTLDEERVPNKDELKAILSAATERGRVIVAFVAFSGLRPEVLGSNDGTDGLRIKDLPEVNIVGTTITFTNIPAMVTVRRELSKARHKYFSFLPSEGCDYVKAHLERRIAAGEALSPDSPVIKATPGFDRKGRTGPSYGSPFIVTRNIAREIRQAMRPRYAWRPYVLRAYFDTQMLLAESNGKVNRDYRQFWMGHKGDIEHRYTVGKGRLPETLIEDMRRAFKEAEPFVTTEATHVMDAKEILLQGFRQQAKAYGIDPMRVRIEKEREGVKLDSQAEIDMLTVEIAKRAAPQTQPPGTTFVNGQGRKNKIVKGDQQLVEHMDEGWELVSNLGEDKYLVRGPARAG